MVPMQRDTRTVKELITEMKDTSELMIDLAYSAVIYGNEEIAEEVIHLEHYMNALESSAQMSILVSTRNRDEAEQLLGVLRIVSAAEMIADAADDIATVVTHDLGLPDALRLGLMASREATIRITVTGDAEMHTTPVGAVEDAAAGAHIIAVRRDDDWLFDPDEKEQLQEDDRVLVRGPRTALETVAGMADGTATLPEQGGETGEELTELVDGLVEMKNVMETAVGLGYSAALFNSEGLAEEVLSLESKSDTMMERLETLILEHADDVDDPAQLRGLLHLAVASEHVTDAALEIAGAVLHDIEAHPVLTEAIKESEEVFTRINAGPGMAGATLGQIDLLQETGATVLALKAGDRWHYNPGPDTAVEEGDRLVIKAPADAADRITDLST